LIVSPHNLDRIATMKKFVATFVALGGLIIVGWAAASLLATHRNIFGYHAVYTGLGGIALLVGGLVSRQD